MHRRARVLGGQRLQVSAQTQRRVKNRRAPVVRPGHHPVAALCRRQQPLIGHRHQRARAQAVVQVGVELGHAPGHHGGRRQPHRQSCSAGAGRGEQLAAHDARQHHHDGLASAGWIGQRLVPVGTRAPAQWVELEGLQQATGGALVIGQCAESIVVPGQRGKQRATCQCIGLEVAQVVHGLVFQPQAQRVTAHKAAKHRVRVDHKIMVMQAVEHIAGDGEHTAQAGGRAVASHHPQPACQGWQGGGVVGGCSLRIEHQRQRRARHHGLQPGDGTGVGPRGHQATHQAVQALVNRVAVATKSQAHAAQQQAQEQVGAAVGQQGAAGRTGHAHKGARNQVRELAQCDAQGLDQRLVGVVVFFAIKVAQQAVEDVLGGPGLQAQAQQITDHAPA